MGLSYNVYLDAKRIYGCKNCKTHLADYDEIVSRVCFLCTIRLTLAYLVLARTSVVSMAKRSFSIQSSTLRPARQATET